MNCNEEFVTKALGQLTLELMYKKILDLKEIENDQDKQYWRRKYG